MSVVCQVPPQARLPTSGPALPAGPPTPVAVLAGFSVGQEAALLLSEQKRAAAIAALDDCNTQNAALRKTIK